MYGRSDILRGGKSDDGRPLAWSPRARLPPVGIETSTGLYRPTNKSNGAADKERECVEGEKWDRPRRIHQESGQLTREASTIAMFIGTPISADFFAAASHATRAAAWVSWPGR